MSRNNLFMAIAAALLLAAGIFLRVHHTSAFDRWVAEKREFAPGQPLTAGYDEAIYTAYVEQAVKTGLANYRDEVVKRYEVKQEAMHDAIVHPMRMTYILASCLWMEIFHSPALDSLHAVSSAAAILHLLLAGVFAWRLGGKTAALGVTALMAFAPLQVCLAQRALVDGVYAFFTTLSFWLFWENLRAPNRRGWLAGYLVSLVVLVLTKEYSAIVVFSFCMIMVFNRWLQLGTVTPKLFAATVIGPAVAVMILVYYAGGVGAFIHYYVIFVQKSRGLAYAYKTQDGPWSRYLLDFLIVTPAVLLLAVGRVFQLDTKNRPDLYCAVFLLFSYIPMACITYGMSLRFAAFWDLPMCWLAFSLLRTLAERLFANRRAVALVAATVLVCGIELREYSRIFVEADTPHPVYDPITRNLLEADKILKWQGQDEP